MDGFLFAMPRRTIQSIVRLVLSILLALPLADPGYAAGNDNTAAADYARELRKLAEAGDAEAQYGLALLLDLGSGPAQDRVEAIAWLHKAAAQDLAAACFTLGLKYEFGATVSRDPLEAAALYRRAALRDVPMAQFRLGSLHLADGPLPEPLAAFAWLGLAAEHGYPDAARARDQAVALLGPPERKRAEILLAELRQQIRQGRAK